MIDTTLASDIFLRFREIIKSDDKIRYEKLLYNINTEAVKISALLSGKTDKFESITGEEISPSNRSHVIEQAKCMYSPLEKTLAKQTKAIEDQGEKQIKSTDKCHALIKKYDYNSDKEFIKKKQKYLINLLMTEKLKNLD